MIKAYPRHTIHLPARLARLLFDHILKGTVLNGPQVSLFEKKFSQYIGTREAIGVSSARIGLFYSLQAFEFCQNDEIIVPAYTHHAMPAVMAACGLKPVFVDVCADTRNIDTSLIEENINSKTKAIFITHMLGQPCQLDILTKMASRHNLKIIEDCAHACGALFGDRRVGSFGDVGIFSFGVGKNMPCFGGGMLTTNDNILAKKIKRLIDASSFPTLFSITEQIAYALGTSFLTKPAIFPLTLYPVMRLFRIFNKDLLDCSLQEKVFIPSLNSFARHAKLANVQAAAGLFQMEGLDALNAKLRQNALEFDKNLAGIKGIRILSLIPDAVSTHLYYQIETSAPDKLRKILLSKGIDTKKDDMVCCPSLDIFPKTGHEFPVARRIPKQSVDLPNNPFLKIGDIEYIAECIQSASSEIAPP